MTPARRANSRQRAWWGAGGVLLAAMLVARPAAPLDAAARPTLLVLVVVDQMRAEYFTRFAAHWTSGFKRLRDESAVYAEARYPYLNTVTCAGHATLSTGAWPRTHGIILNQWYRRDEQRVRTCTGDDAVHSVPYEGAPEKEGQSAAQLRVPTLAERLRAKWPRSRAVTVSLKARSAIMMAGRGATAATWRADGDWVTSSAFMAAPDARIARRLAARTAAETRESWPLLRDPSWYAADDDTPGERPPRGWTPLFPHLLQGAAPGADETRWETSPFADAALGAIAADLVGDFALGRRGDTVDFLGVSFSVTDLVGHAFGPDSREVEDTLARLDVTLGTLLRALDAKVGRGRYVLGLSADHGVGPIPEARRAAGLDAGRVPLQTVTEAAEQALAAALGPGPHVARTEYSETYLTAAARARITPAIAADVVSAIRALPGVQTAIWTPSLADQTIAADTIVAAIRAGFDPERSGDFTAAPKPYWYLVPGRSPSGGNGATHGTANDYDQHVPLILFGGGIAPGIVDAPVTPADLAPTLAAAVGLPMPGVDGRPLPLPRAGSR